MGTGLKVPLQGDTCRPKKGEIEIQLDVALLFPPNSPLKREARLLQQATLGNLPSQLHFLHLSPPPVFIHLLLLPPPTSLDLEQKPSLLSPPPLPISCFSILLVTAAAKQTRRAREMMCQWKVL